MSVTSLRSFKLLPLTFRSAVGLWLVLMTVVLVLWRESASNYPGDFLAFFMEVGIIAGFVISHITDQEDGWAKYIYADEITSRQTFLKLPAFDNSNGSGISMVRLFMAGMEGKRLTYKALAA